MKLYRNAILLAVVMLVVAGAYFGYKTFFYKPPVVDDGSPNLNLIPIVDLVGDYTELDKVTVVNGTETLVFARLTEEVWGVVEPQNVKVDQYKSKAVFINAAPLNASKIIEENCQDLAKYGLDKPSASITVLALDGSQKTVLIGKKTSTGENSYGMISGDETRTVYTISEYTTSKYLYRLADIKDKALFAGVVSDDVTVLQLFRSGKNVFSASMTEDKSWNITSPIAGSADLAKITPMAEAVVKLQAAEYITLNASDKTLYGFDNPQYALRVKTPVRDATLLIGKDKEKEVSAYASFEGSSEVFTVKLADLNFVDRPLKEMIEVFPYIINIDDLVRFDIAFDGHSDVFVLEINKEDRTKSKFYMNGKDASMSDAEGNQLFRLVYREAIGLTMDDVEVGITPSGTPDLSITYTKATGESMKVDYISKDDFQFYVVKNGVYSGILVRKKELDDPQGLRETYAALAQAVNAAQQ